MLLLFGSLHNFVLMLEKAHKYNVEYDESLVKKARKEEEKAKAKEKAEAKKKIEDYKEEKKWQKNQGSK